jgi:23S rRNA (guanosine2251-2'-O)-methyltransferase
MRVVYGFHAVTQCLNTSAKEVKTFFVQSDKKDPRLADMISNAQSAGIRIERVSKKELDDKYPNMNHQGVVLNMADKVLGDEKSFKIWLDTMPDNPLILVLDGIQDPHNLGACLRSAAAFGVDAVVWPKDKQAQITPTVQKVASGAVEHLNLFVVTNLSRALEAMKTAGIWTVGTVLNDEAKPLSEINLKGPIAIIMGSEGEGLRHGTQKHCDHLAYIPMSNSMQSLNVSVATGIVLYAARTRK